MRFSLSSSHALLEMKCDIQISYQVVSNAHVHQLTVSFNNIFCNNHFAIGDHFDCIILLFRK